VFYGTTTTLRAQRPINYETTYTISGQEADDGVQIVDRNSATIIYNPKGEAAVNDSHVMIYSGYDVLIFNERRRALGGRGGI
jgi:hypothetical protein